MSVEYQKILLMRKVDTNGRINEGMTQCWKSLGSPSTGGYGQITIDKKAWNTHRLSWWLHNGCPEMTAQHIIGHKCDNPTCCNPDHLELISQRQNVADAYDRGIRIVPDPKPIIRISTPCFNCVAHHKKCDGEEVCAYCVETEQECIKKTREARAGDFKKGECSGEKNSAAKLTDEQVAEIRRRYDAGLKYGQLKPMASEFGISYGWLQQLVARMRRV